MQFRETWKALFVQIRPVLGRYGVGLGLILMSAVAGIMVPRSIGQIFNMISEQDLVHPLSMRPLFIFAAMLNTFFLLKFVAQWHFNLLRQRLVSGLSMSLFKRYQKIPRYSRILKPVEAYQQILFEDVNMVANYLTAILPKSLTRLGLLVGSFGSLMALSWKLSLTLGLLILGTIYVFSRTQRSIKRMLTDVERQRVTFKTQIHALLRNIDTLRAMSCTAFGEKVLIDRDREMQTSMRKVQLRNEAWTTLLLAVLSLYFVVFAVSLCMMIRSGACDAKWASQYFTYLGMLLVNTLNSSASFQTFAVLQKALQRMQGLDRVEASAEAIHPPLLVAGNEWVGIVGPTGCGKTTALRSFLNLDNEPNQPSVGYLDQEVPIFPVSLADNISMGRNHTLNEIQLALDAACVSPQFYGAYLGDERPLNEKILSGGEKLRIGLARAIIGRPKAIVLDEPSAALDAETERLLLNRMRAYLGGQSQVLVVTHSPKFMQAMDRIIDMAGRSACV